MPRSLTDEAIVLRTYNVGETDRFCVVLTQHHGRLVARVMGARKLLSRRGKGLLPLHRVHMTWEERSFGNIVTSVQPLNAHIAAWHDPHTFSCAAQGIELLLKLTEDGEPLADAYQLTADFLAACSMTHPQAIVHLYTLKLLQILGYLPSSDSVPGQRPSRELLRILETLDTMTFADSPVLVQLEAELLSFVRSLLGNQLGVTLAAPGVSFCISSGVTPICQ